MNSRTDFADGAVALSWLGWLSSHIAELNPIMQFASFMVAILSGLFAIYAHSQMLKLRRQHADHD